MADYRLSEDAAADLAVIADYTIERFGIEQARRYRAGLFECFSRVAAFPRMGSPCDAIRPGVWRLEHRSHVIYYRQIDERILILRLLGVDQDPHRHL